MSFMPPIAKRSMQAFAALARERPDALFVGPDAFFNSRRVQLAILAARYTIPATFAVRDYVEAGGLMSYGTNINDAYRQVGIYAGRILRVGGLPSCPSSSPLHSSLSSTSTPPKRSVLKCRRRCSPAPTR